MERKNATIGEETKKEMGKLWSQPHAKGSPPASADAATRDRSDDLDDLDQQPPDLEDPAQAWVMLVEACQIKDKTERDNQIRICLAMARSSHWTQQILDQLDQDFYDSQEEPTVGWEEEPNSQSW